MKELSSKKKRKGGEKNKKNKIQSVCNIVPFTYSLVRKLTFKAHICGLYVHSQCQNDLM